MFKDAAKSLISPFLSLALFMLAVGYFLTYTSVRMKVDDYSTIVIGVLGSSYYLGFFLGATKVEKLISRVRHIRAFAFFISITTASLLMQGLSIHPLSWTVFRFLNGFSVAALYVVIESWFLVVSPDKYRGRVLSLYMLGIYLSSAISQFFIDFYDVRGFEPYILAGCLSALSLIPVSLTKTSVPELHEPSTGILLKLMKISPTGVGGCVIGGMMVSCIYSFFPVFAIEQGLSVPILLFIAIASGGLFQWPVGYLSDKFDRRKVMIGVSLLIILVAILMNFSVENPIAIFLLTAFISGFSFTIYPMSITQACDRLSSSHLVAATGALMLFYGIGAIVGPLIAPFFMKTIPPAGIYAYLGFTGVIVTLLALYSLFSKKGTPEGEKEMYIPMAGTTPTASELDPRN